VFVEGVRLLITLALTAGGFLAGETFVSWWPDTGADPDRAAVWGAMLGAGIGYVLGGVTGRRFDRAVTRADQLMPTRNAPELLVGGFGLLMGVIVGAIASVPVVALLPAAIGWPLGGLIVLTTSAFGWRILGSRSAELAAWAGLTDPGVLGTSDSAATDSYLIDSSAAIDGRLVELFRSRLVRGTVCVAAFVVDELQGLADSDDSSLRRRGRRGLDHLDVMRRLDGVSFTVLEDTVPEVAEVDAKLIVLSLRQPASLVTTDHNLAAAAELRGVDVVNPHAIGESLRLPVASGDHVELTIERAGSEPGQGVGYLDDGTMVVVSNAADDVGVTLDVEVANLVTTAVGRLVFAKRV
jgi:uncharacterized protein YacL